MQGSSTFRRQCRLSCVEVGWEPGKSNPPEPESLKGLEADRDNFRLLQISGGGVSPMGSFGQAMKSVIATTPFIPHHRRPNSEDHGP